MKILPFPDRSQAELAAEQEWLAQLDAALTGQRQDAAATQWRKLSDDVRALPPAMSEDFELRMQQRLDDLRGGAGSAMRPRRRLPSFSRPYELGALLSAAAAVVVALLLVAPWRSPTHSRPGNAISSSGAKRNGIATEGPRASAGAAATFAEERAQSAPVFAPAPAPLSSGRLQQVAASIALSTASGQVESVSARVSQVTREDHGFVQSSRVEEKRHGDSEAHLTLRIPSAKLSEALASLEALAPVKEKSQSLQDITSSFDLAKQRLADARSQREALLRALAKAYTEAEIESLRARLSIASREVAQASAALQGIERRGHIATVQVTILGDSHASGGAGGLTIKSGLHDAGQALTVSLVVILIALSILLPLALVLAAVWTAHRAWRRHARERSLDAA